MLIVWICDFKAWNRPIQPSSYSVVRPNGTLMPSPNVQSLAIGTETYMFGTKLKPPASPPSPPSGWFAAGCEASFRNLIDGVMMLSTAAPWMLGNCDSAAGFHHIAETSSVNAAPPANALPSELALCSFSWKPVANACDAPSANASVPTACATCFFLIDSVCMISPRSSGLVAASSSRRISAPFGPPAPFFDGLPANYTPAPGVRGPRFGQEFQGFQGAAISRGRRSGPTAT